MRYHLYPLSSNWLNHYVEIGQMQKSSLVTMSLSAITKKSELKRNEYVQKERLQALEPFPQVKPENAAKLRIYPMSIEPRAGLPGDMKDNYHFGVIYKQKI